MIVVALYHPQEIDLFQLGEKEFCLATVIIKVVRYRVGWFVKIKYREMKRSCFLRQGDLQVIIYPEVGVQLPVYMPAQLIIPRGGRNAYYVGTVEEVLCQLVVVQFELEYCHIEKECFTLSEIFYAFFLPAFFKGFEGCPGSQNTALKFSILSSFTTMPSCSSNSCMRVGVAK